MLPRRIATKQPTRVSIYSIKPINFDDLSQAFNGKKNLWTFFPHCFHGISKEKKTNDLVFLLPRVCGFVIVRDFEDSPLARDACTPRRFLGDVGITRTPINNVC